MRSVFKTIIAASALAATSLAVVQPAQARDHTGAAVAAGIIGLGVGAALASDRGYGRGGYYYSDYPSGYYAPSYSYGYAPSYGYGYAPSYGYSYGYDYGRGYGYGRDRDWRRDHWRDRHDRWDRRDGDHWRR
jgi:hypothetical protein